MRRLLAIAGTGVTAVLLHPLRAAVTAACVVAVLVPYLVGLAISRGVEAEARAAVEYGADLYVTGERFGRPVPVPQTVADDLHTVPGVTEVVGRIVGRVELGKDRVSAVVVGVPTGRLPAGLDCVDGRLPTPGRPDELVIGSDLARRLNLKVGSLVPPFYRSRAGDRISIVVGVFRSDVTLWQARLVVTTLETAAHIFDQPGEVTDLLVYCRPGYEEEVRRTILRRASLTVNGPPIRPRVVGRGELAATLPTGLGHREGVFTALFVFAFAVTVLAVLVTSGLGLSDRRREVGLLKAIGWQTDEVLLRSLTESLLIALTGAATAVVLAGVWLTVFNGYWVAGVFLAGVDRDPGFLVPARLTPVPALLAFLIAFVVVATGSLYSTWRASSAPAREAMR